MKSQLNKILIVTLVILFFTLSKSYSIEDVTELTDAINEAREEFNNSPKASTEQSWTVSIIFLISLSDLPSVKSILMSGILTMY